jgi:hypothetical protein
MVMGWELIRAAETIKLALQRWGATMKVACWMLLLLLRDKSKLCDAREYLQSPSHTSCRIDFCTRDSNLRPQPLILRFLPLQLLFQARAPCVLLPTPRDQEQIKKKPNDRHATCVHAAQQGLLVSAAVHHALHNHINTACSGDYTQSPAAPCREHALAATKWPPSHGATARARCN